MMSDWKVELVDENNTSEFYVELHGPKDSESFTGCGASWHAGGAQRAYSQEITGSSNIHINIINGFSLVF